MMFNDEILQATFCGTNVRVNAVCQCHNPVRTDDGPTALGFCPYGHCNLKLEYALSMNRNVLNDCIYLTSSSDQ